MEADGDDEDICRYCFEGQEAGELISPCNCMGGQKYVHLSCLRRWQRMVLVSQPTHPAFYDRDVRHHKCNVCQAEFTCAPPTRHELMESFTGPELGSLIAAEERFSTEMDRELEGLPPAARERSSSRHWIRGVYLITGVDEDDGKLSVPISDASNLSALRARLGPQLAITVQGRTYRLAPGGSLEDVREADLPEAFANLRTPATICLASTDTLNCGDDHVAAVNLTRPFPEAPRPLEVRTALDYVCSKYPGARTVEVTHYNGGPCDPDEIVTCVVPGGGGRGWTVVKELQDAIQLAHSRAAKRWEAQGDVAGGQTVRLVGLQSQPHLNGEVGMALRFVEASGRWLVRLPNGEGKQLKPANLEAMEGRGGRVFAFWGDARWSRTQLLGEIARGHWGLCRASISELTASPPQRWRQLQGRLAFAPVTEMTETFLQEGQRQMAALRAARDAAVQASGDSDEGEA